MQLSQLENVVCTLFTSVCAVVIGLSRMYNDIEAAMMRKCSLN